MKQVHIIDGAAAKTKRLPERVPFLEPVAERGANLLSGRALLHELRFIDPHAAQKARQRWSNAFPDGPCLKLDRFQQGNGATQAAQLAIEKGCRHPAGYAAAYDQNAPEGIA